MASSINRSNTGEGTRPTTSGGVDNIGAGEKFAAGASAAGATNAAPSPPERMADKRKTAQSSRHDDSAPFGLTEDLTPQTNKDPTQP